MAGDKMARRARIEQVDNGYIVTLAEGPKSHEVSVGRYAHTSIIKALREMKAWMLKGEYPKQAKKTKS